jgi:hypothetical protein
MSGWAGVRIVDATCLSQETPEANFVMIVRRRSENMAETAEEKFVRLATARVNKVLKMLDGIGKLKAPSYKHDKRAERFAQIKKTLIEAVEKAIPEETPGKEAAPESGFKLE